MPRKAKRECPQYALEKGIHAVDLREAAKVCLRDFLGNKITHRDQPVSKKQLLSDFCVATVLRTQFDDATFDFIHEKCLSQIPKQKWYRDATVPWNVHFLLGLLSELKLLSIPKEFQPGLLLLYFKFCKGFDIPPPPLL